MSHRITYVGSRRRRWWLLIAFGGAVLAFGTAAAVAWAFRDPAPAPAKAAFRVAELRGISAPGGRGKAGTIGARVKKMVNGYYQVAFMETRPEVAGSGPPPGRKVLAFFATSARERALKDMGALSLGTELRASLEGLRPQRQVITKMTVYTDSGGGVPIVIATIEMRAAGKPVREGFLERIQDALDGTEGDFTFIVEHRLTVWLTPQSGRYRILAYDALLKAEDREQRASFGRIR